MTCRKTAGVEMDERDRARAGLPEQAPEAGQTPSCQEAPDGRTPFHPAHPAARVLEAVEDLFFTLDREWRFTYLNRRALREVGQPAEALLGRVIWEAYPQLLGTDVEAQYRRALAEQVAVRFETRGVFSGRWYEVHAYPGPEELTVHGRDVSGRRGTEEALRESEERF